MTHGFSLQSSLLCFALAMVSACAQDTEKAERLARIEALEQRVQEQQQHLATMRVMLDSFTKPARPSATAAPDFRIHCPKPWQDLGAIEQTAWACRSPQPSPSGAWSNCNVTRGPTNAGMTPQEYFALAMSASPQLKAARRISEGPSRVAERPSYRAVYEHNLLMFPLRVLSETIIHGESAYAISCSAAPETFGLVEATFHEIIGSFRFAS